MRRLPVSFALAFALVAGACSSDPGEEQFVDALVSARPDLSDADARCVVGELQKSYNNPELTSLIVDSEEEQPSDAELQQFAVDQLDAVQACDLEGQVSPGMVQSFANVNGVTSQVAECAVGKLQEQFGFWELTDLVAADESNLRFDRRQFEAIFTCGDRSKVIEQLQPQLDEQGVESAQAPCVATAIADSMEVADLSVLYSGQMTDDFFTLYFEALETCDALPE